MEKKPITWITKNGKHIPIYDEPSEDEKKKEKQIADNESEALEITKRKDYQVIANKSWEDKLSQNERDAIADYTNKTDEEINTALRKKKIPEKLRPIIKNIDSALSKYELSQSIITYRGINVSAFDNGIQVGSSFTEKGYSSTSVDKFIAGDFLKSEKDVLMRIVVPSGKGRGAFIGNVSNKPSEREFLLARDTKFTITKIGQVQGYIMVDVTI